jgi:hypothetical protein
VGADNACYLGVCAEVCAEEAIGSVPALAVGGGFARGRPCDDFRLVGLKLVFLIVTRAVSVLGLSRREAWWKDAEILILRHQLAVARRERPRVHSRLTWPDRVWLALLAGTLPVERLAGFAADRDSSHDFALAPRHCPPPLGAAVAPQPLRTSAGAP